jgi:hypothetical protein
MKRDNKIRSLGYNLIVKWETSSKEISSQMLELTIDPKYFRVIN